MRLSHLENHSPDLDVLHAKTKQNAALPTPNMLYSWLNDGLPALGFSQNLPQDAWHQRMALAFGYDPSLKTSHKWQASESFRNAFESGDWTQLGLNIDVAPSSKFSQPQNSQKNTTTPIAAFTGGDTANADDDTIVVNQDFIERAAHDNTAKAQLNKALIEEMFHALERKIHKDKDGDMQLNTSGEIAFMAQGTGSSFDEGKFASEFLKQPYHAFEDLRETSAVMDQGTVGCGNNKAHAEFNTPEDIFDVALGDSKSSFRDNVSSMLNENISRTLEVWPQYQNIWNNSAADKDLDAWLSMEGTRSTTKGVTQFVGWALGQSDPRAQLEKKKLLSDGLLSDVSWLNDLSNNTIDGKDGNYDEMKQEISYELLRHVPAKKLVELEGTRAGTFNVQEAIGQQLANDASAFKALHHYFVTGNNGAHFLNKFTNEQIRTMNPHLLLSIPIEQLNTAEGTRGAAALQKIFEAFDPSNTASKHAHHAGRWENHLKWPTSADSGRLAMQRYVELMDNLNGAYYPLAETANIEGLAPDGKYGKLKKLHDDIKDPNFKLTPTYLENFLKDAIGSEQPSREKANSTEEIDLLNTLNFFGNYGVWKDLIANHQGAAGVKTFSDSTLGRELARWSLRSDPGNGNGAGAATNITMGHELTEMLFDEDGDNLKVMPEGEQQRILDGWLEPNKELYKTLDLSLLLPMLAVAKLKDNGKLSGNEGPLVEFFDETIQNLEKSDSSASTRQLLGNNHLFGFDIFNLLFEGPTDLNDESVDAEFLAAFQGALAESFENLATAAETNQTQNATGDYAIVGFLDHSHSNLNAGSPLYGLPPGQYGYDQFGNLYLQSQGENELVSGFVYINGQFGTRAENGTTILDANKEPFQGLIYVRGHGVSPLGSDGNPTHTPINPDFHIPLAGIISSPRGNLYKYDTAGNVYDRDGNKIEGAVYIKDKFYRYNGEKIYTREGVRIDNFKYVEGYGVSPVDKDGNPTLRALKATNSRMSENRDRSHSGKNDKNLTDLTYTGSNGKEYRVDNLSNAYFYDEKTKRLVLDPNLVILNGKEYIPKDGKLYRASDGVIIDNYTYDPAVGAKPKHPLPNIKKPLPEIEDPTPRLRPGTGTTLGPVKEEGEEDYDAPHDEN